MCAYCCSYFICRLFDYAVGTSDHIASNGWVTVKNELKRKWKESVMAEFKAQSHLPKAKRKTIKVDDSAENLTEHFWNTSWNR